MTDPVIGFAGLLFGVVNLIAFHGLGHRVSRAERVLLAMVTVLAFGLAFIHLSRIWWLP